MLEIPLEIRRADGRSVILVGDMPPGEIPGVVERLAAARSYIAVMDRRVAGLHAFPEDRPGWRRYLVDAGEEHKTAACFISLCEAILRDGVDRKTVLVAVGGGVVGDIAGFAAATLLRGLRLVQVPTTLLAQVDSSVGGKTGINMAGGKNLLGAFYQPELVVASTEFLKTLPEREYLSGLAEVAKYGVLGDREFFFELSESSGKLAARDPELLSRIVARCCRMKAAVVGNDEKESENRRLLNLGHTFGHALEALAGYDGSLLHGEAVSIGMAMAMAYAVKEGVMPRDEEELALDVFRALRLPVRFAFRERLLSDGLPLALAQDKKAADGGLTLILPASVGECVIRENEPVAKVAEFIRAL